MVRVSDDSAAVSTRVIAMQRVLDMARKKTVVIGFLGTLLDAGRGPKRWEKWRPTVALCQHEDFVVDRLVLLHPPNHANLVKELAADIRSVSPETELDPRPMTLANPWDLEEVYGALHDFALQVWPALTGPPSRLFFFPLFLASFFFSFSPICLDRCTTSRRARLMNSIRSAGFINSWLESFTRR